MPARLLAYGGTSFSERRRIGQWPAVPEATLRDGYGLQQNAWSYGFGLLGNQPFLIFRQRQNVENRGGYPFSLLLDPGEAVWQRFAWNAAALASGVLQTNAPVLFETPETCSGDALEALVSGLADHARPVTAGPLSSAVVASLAEPVMIPGPRPEVEAFASELASLPICFRAGAGWLAGGASAHGRAFGANLVIDDQAKTGVSQPAAQGEELLRAWHTASERGLVQAREDIPAFLWEGNPVDFLQSVTILHDLLNAESATEGLLARADQATELRGEIEQASVDLLTRGSGPLGPRASSMLLELALNKKLKIDPATAGRLDSDTVLTALRRYGSPPKPIPKTLPLARDLRVRLWIDYLGRLQGDVRENLQKALKQLPDLTASEREALANAALASLPGSSERLTDWKSFRADPELWPLLQPTLRELALRRFQRSDDSGVRAYLLLGEDPDGSAAKQALVREDDFARLTSVIRSISRDYPDEAAEWLRHRPAKVSVPRPSRESPPDLPAAVAALLFEPTDSAEAQAQTLRAKYEKALSPETRAALDELVEQHCDSDGAAFAAKFGGKYMALADALSFFSERAQDRLVGQLAAHQPNFVDGVARDLSHALNQRDSHNGYTRALSRLILRDRTLSKKVAALLTELPSDLETKLKKRLLAKDVSR